MDFDLSERSEAWREKLQAFFDTEVLPRHRAWLDHAAKGEAAPFMVSPQPKSRKPSACRRASRAPGTGAAITDTSGIM